MLASWAEQIPVQAPGDWVGCKLWNAREWGPSMILSYTHEDEGCEFHMAIDDRGWEQTRQRQTKMCERGWQKLDEHGWWRTEFAETDPQGTENPWSRAFLAMTTRQVSLPTSIRQRASKR
ncbi:hypothetical protein PV726_25060 [Streptomyces europaeiscabiei]|uniref:hypothetical protein n=1 Tax=Streptomyces europaeiscabiei TaxID=146819 RepID=UPI0029BC4ADB|nr:hypothetical protein [Streptomyces europaeiscabiei]MDX3693558.1 hypothetical protein [Streptomyces europaeiscabiei]